MVMMDGMLAGQRLWDWLYVKGCTVAVASCEHKSHGLIVNALDARPNLLFLYICMKLFYELRPRYMSMS